MWGSMYFVVFHCLETVPEIASIADQVPSYFFAVKVESSQELVIPLFHALEFFLGCFRAFREREYAGDLCVTIEESTVELPVDVVFSLELFGVSE